MLANPRCDGGEPRAKHHDVKLGDLPSIIRTLVPAYHHLDLFESRAGHPGPRAGW